MRWTCMLLLGNMTDFLITSFASYVDHTHIIPQHICDHASDNPEGYR